MSIAAAVALVLCPTAAHAQETPQSAMQEFMRRASRQQELIQQVLGVSQTIPRFSEGGTRADMETVLRQGRAWVAQSRRVISDVRAAVPGIPSLPADIPAELRQSDNIQQQALIEVVNGVEHVIATYEGALAAIERRDRNAALQMSRSMIEAAVLTMRVIRDINLSQARTLGEDHPQSHLLRGSAHSYDALMTMIGYQRARLFGEEIVQEQLAQTISTAASGMRQAVERGRRAAVATVAELAAAPTSNSEEAAFKDRVVSAFRTYSASFDKEAEMAGLLDSAASVFRERRSHAEIERDLAPIQERLGALDEELGADVRRRIAMMQGQ
jgi:hypothetical protein